MTLEIASSLTSFAPRKDIFVVARHFSAEVCPQLLRNSVAGGQPFLYEKSQLKLGRGKDQFALIPKTFLGQWKQLSIRS